MTFEIENSDDPTQRPVQTERFSLAAEGVVDFGKQFPKCSFSKALQQSLAAVKRACGKARVGGGLARNLAGAADNTSIADSLRCNLGMNFYNLGDGAALRLDGDPAALRFTVPDNLLEPVSGVLNSVVGATFTITSKSRTVKVRGKSRKLKIGSAIGCNGRTRTAIVDFTDVTGDTQRAEKEVPC